MQIVLPLVVLVGYGLIRLVRVVTWRTAAVDGATDLEKVAGEIYPSRT